MANMISGIVAITLGAVVLSTVFITQIKGTNTSTWTSGEVALWGTLSLVGIIGLVYGVLDVFGLV